MKEEYITIYAIMPSEIYSTKDLTAEEKLIAERITALCKKEGYAWISNKALADMYAHAKVDEYNEELSLELADLDIEYDTMKTMYDTMLEELRAQQESEKTATSTAAQDTGLLQS